MGLDVIEWTFDPLQALNAHLNIDAAGRGRRGVRREHLRRVQQPAAPGIADRSFGRALEAVGAARRATDSRSPGARWRVMRRVIEAPVVNVARVGRWPGAGEPAAARGPRVLVDVPGRLHRDAGSGPRSRTRWRMATRLAFQTYFARGYRAVDFILSEDRRRGQYLLEAGLEKDRVNAQWHKSRAIGVRPQPGKRRLSPLSRRPAEPRPASRCRWMWKTVWPASALVLKTVRKPPSA